MGPINEVYFTIKMDAGMQATSFKADDKVYISGDKLLPIERFLPKPKALTKGACLSLGREGKVGIGCSPWTARAGRAPQSKRALPA